jgi:5-methyltetrahydropteroyltriglutamate--homocysteine methyltransferase
MAIAAIAPGYSFLPEFAASKVDQISIEAAEPKLDCAILARLPDKQIILGVLDLGAKAVETPALVAERIRHALAYVAPERLIVAPDCGLKYLPREVACAKLQAMVAGAAIVRRELGG